MAIELLLEANVASSKTPLDGMKWSEQSFFGCQSDYKLKITRLGFILVAFWSIVDIIIFFMLTKFVTVVDDDDDDS